MWANVDAVDAGCGWDGAVEMRLYSGWLKRNRIRSFSTFGTWRRVRTTSRRRGRMACQERSILFLLYRGFLIPKSRVCSSGNSWRWILATDLCWVRETSVSIWIVVIRGYKYILSSKLFFMSLLRLWCDGNAVTR